MINTIYELKIFASGKCAEYEIVEYINMHSYLYVVSLPHKSGVCEKTIFHEKEMCVKNTRKQHLQANKYESRILFHVQYRLYFGRERFGTNSISTV